MAVNSSKTIFTMADDNAVDFNTLKKQIQSVLGSSSWDLEDMCVYGGMNIWAKYKPENIDKAVNITDADRATNGYSMAIYLSGIQTSGDLAIKYIDSIEWVKPSKYNRIRDFDGYNHTTRSQLQLASDVINPTSVNTSNVQIWTGANPDGVPFDSSIVNMWTNAEAYHGIKLSEFTSFHWVALTYSGFVRATGQIATSFDELRSKLQGSSPAYNYNAYYDFLLEPKGRNGKLIVYGKRSAQMSSVQLLAPTLIVNSGAVHPCEIQGWTPSALKIGTTTTGFNITYNQWVSGDHKGQYIMFGTDDDLYFTFTIKNNSTSKKVLGSSLKLQMTIGNSSYYSWFCDDSSSASPSQIGGAFSVNPLQSYGSYYDPTTLTTRPRFFVQLKNLINVFPAFFNKQKYDVKFSLYYTGVNPNAPLSTDGITESGILVSSFTLPMQCTGKATTNPIDPPSDIKPVPPSWDVKKEDL